jgi:hypothetical protein
LVVELVEGDKFGSIEIGFRVVKLRGSFFHLRPSGCPNRLAKSRSAGGDLHFDRLENRVSN